MAKNKEYSVQVTDGAFYVTHATSEIIGSGKSFDLALLDFEEKTSQYEILQKQSGFSMHNPILTNTKTYNLGYTAKWFIAFVFVSIMSIPLSFSISNGISNGVSKVDLPKGSALWSSIGDAIIKASRSKSLEDQSRQDEIVDAIKIISSKISPYISAFAEPSNSPSTTSEDTKR